MAEEGHKVGLLIPPILALLAFIVTCFFNFLAAQDACCLHWGIFHSNTGNISDKYYLEITPAGWAFSIWGIIYTYQALWLLYALSLFCRRNPTTGEYLYYSPVYMTPIVYLVMVVNFALNITWLILWDREELWWGVVVLFLTALTLYIAIGSSMCVLNKKAHVMIEDGIAKEIKLVIALLHNGLAMYGTWTTIATLLNVGVALIYRDPHWQQQTLSALCLGILTLEITVWIVLDNIIIQRYTRYLFTPYFVLIWALSASIDKNWDSSNPVAIFTAALLVIAVVATFLKIILVIRRSKKDPMYTRLTREHERLNITPTTQYS